MSKFDDWLDKHERIDTIYTNVYIETFGRVRRLKSKITTWYDLKPYKVGGYFLDHGHEPSRITEITDGLIYGTSLVTGKGVVSDIHACGPLITDEKTATEMARASVVE